MHCGRLTLGTKTDRMTRLSVGDVRTLRQSWELSLQACGARKPRFAFLPATIRPRWSLPVGQSLHSRTGCICEGCSEESVGPLLGELARVSEDDLNLGIPDLQACQHIGEPGTGNML